MKKKILLFISIFSITMLFGINVKAATSCIAGSCSGSASSGPPCIARSSDTCTTAGTGCTWTCSACNNGGTPSGASCICTKPSSPVVTNNCSGGSYSINGTGCDMIVTSSGPNLTCTSGDTNLASASLNNSTCHITAVGSPTGESCKKDVTISFKYTKDCGTNSDTSTKTVTIKTPWPQNGQYPVTVWKEENTHINRTVAEQNDYGVAYEGCDGPKLSGNTKYWICTKYTRGCGKQPPNPEPHCYKKDGLLYWGTYSSVTNGKEEVWDGWELVSGIDDPKMCVSKFSCTTKKPSKSTETACNGQGEIEGTYVKTCESIYTIKCKETIRTLFSGPVLDSSLESSQNAYLSPGEGFKYKYAATSNFECRGYFDNERYEKVKKYINNYAKDVDENLISLDGEFYKKAEDGLKYMKESYTKWDPEYKKNSNPVVVIHDEIGNKKLTTVTLEPVKDKELVLVDKCGKLPKDKSDANKTKGFSYTEKYYLEREMPMAYLNNKGKIVYGNYSCQNCELGKQFFATDNRDYIKAKTYGNYNYVVNASGLGYRGFAKDSTKCRLILLDNELIYRHVDLNDPFLKKSDHEIGENWKNSKYDFTRILKQTIWKQESLFNTVRLNTDTNKNIKSETSGNPNYYIGACTRNNASNNDTICKLLKQAQK